MNILLLLLHLVEPKHFYPNLHLVFGTMDNTLQHNLYFLLLLQPVLVAQVALYLAAKQAHWIVRGPQFASLHELFGQVADSAESAADTVAERIARTRLHFLHGVSATIGLPPSLVANVTGATRTYPVDTA
jgi:hypothetical protein